MKVCINGPGHVTKMAFMAIKNVYFFFLQKKKAYDLCTWHEALGNGALQSLYKSHCDDSNLFTARST